MMRAYKDGDLKPYFSLAYDDLSSALKISRKPKREQLAKSLARTAKRFEAAPEVFSSIETLAKPETMAIVAGQQTGLLLGPYYTISKAISAIKLAEQLSKKEKPVVPIFWIASQDHDYKEVNHAYLLDNLEDVSKLEIDLPKDMPIGRIGLEDRWLDELLNEIDELSYGSEFKDEVGRFLTESFELADSYSDWFVAMMYKLLGKYGLIIIDPMQKDIAELFKPILLRELNDPLASSSLINQAADALTAIGYKPQIGRAEHATNLFLEEDGHRVLLKYVNGLFLTDKKTYSKDELVEIIEKDASMITPAAGLRPICQDYMLPTAAMVVGPGELAYFAQLKGVYELNGVAMPLVYPRLRITISEPPVTRIMRKFGLELPDIADLEAIKIEKALEASGHKEKFDSKVNLLEESFEEMLQSIQEIDPSLNKTIVKAEEHLQKTLETLKRKSARAQLNKDCVYEQQFTRLEKQLFPLGVPQERLISPFSYFLKFGIDYMMRRFMEMPPRGSHLLQIQ